MCQKILNIYHEHVVFTVTVLTFFHNWEPCYTFSFTATFHAATSVNLAPFVVGHSIFNRCKFSAGEYMEVTLHLGT